MRFVKEMEGEWEFLGFYVFLSILVWGFTDNLIAVGTFLIGALFGSAITHGRAVVRERKKLLDR